MEGFLESDILNNIWHSKYFQDSPFEAKLSERVSTASSLRRNENGGLEAADKRERKVTGTKVDILFKAGHHEVGCCEVGKEGVLSIDDKYLDDGMIKSFRKP